MAYELGGIDLSFIAAEDLSGMQYRFVHLASDTTVDMLDSGTEFPVGILQNAPDENEVAVVRVLGVSKLVMNDAVSVGTLVKAEYVGADDNGKGDAADTEGDIARGVCIGASGAEDDVGTVLLCVNEMSVPV
jgi:hypothetical protein